MASSFSSSYTNTAFPSSSSMEVTVTQEEFNAFHNIDRILFTRLVLALNRDINQSSQVIGFLLCIEQLRYARDVIAYLVSLPDAFIDTMANEIVVCLSFLYNKEHLRFFLAENGDNDYSVIPLIMRLTGGRLTLRFIHENRDIVLHGLNTNLTNICHRAFEDICVRIERHNNEKLFALDREKVIEDMKIIRLGAQQETPNRLFVPQERSPLPPILEETNMTSMGIEEAKVDEVKEVMMIPADERTIFLTFSKGYPVSETEVRVFFTRRFGEVIEAIEMQEVRGNGQTLYAKMVLKMQCVSTIEKIMGASKRNKFTINGKHVLARKYVPRNPNSFASPSTSHV